MLLLRRPVTKNDCNIFFKCQAIVKNLFGLSSDIVFLLSVIYKSHRQVLTPINNSQLLLKLEILDKLIPVKFHKTASQRKCNIITGSSQFRRNASSRDLDS
jgi:hypothetical protein